MIRANKGMDLFILRKGVIYRKMVGNIFNPKKFKGKSVYRLDVNFKINDK